ncbi:Heat-labile enterotoxin IIA, A chain [Beauveria brongniartii RCEF 3172]|uniref:Heat-labile enterotoxin IIA, A chain n=1 Tax=Beauveria brongniartii RCEF 3172 TaxID=1081107 RepID=A0A162J274_9HYPO|nr:Heat-labile enterotoxin IIA, A chain [Beauveria brongniartii RCEF 3172]
MQPRLLAALLALQAVAAPQSPDEQPSPEPTGTIVTDDGIELDTSFITEPFFEILSNYTDLLNSTVDANLHAPVERLRARALRVVTAEAASKMKAPGHGAQGVFFRGDSRPPSLIFATGFQPQGSDPSLINHLSFAGNSGFVSLTRNPHTAEQYAFGRTGGKTEKGYIYVISYKNVPDGYWLPGIYPPEKNPAVYRNQEFAVLGAVRAESISHAYEVTRAKPSARMTKIRNEDYILRRSSSCFFSKCAIFCDPAKYMEKASKGRRIRLKISKTFRVSARAGGAVAFAVLSPYAHDVLDLIKSWDNPIGHAVTWFDNSMASFQEAIGGPQVPEIYGNTLKLRLICWLRGEQRWPNDVDRACARLRASEQPRPVETVESKRLKSVNAVLIACEKLENPDVSLATAELKAELLDRCEEFRAMAHEQDK